ncbi:MAG TPA: hypothetical protein VFO39_08030 [Candidatus Sulfotelmatobacter sp.]|nr:hypothetical protein [Candidatus Sulfotelmatobacter sp.]
MITFVTARQSENHIPCSPPSSNSRLALKTVFRYNVASMDTKEKNPTKDIVLWIIAVLLVGLAIYWYKR